MVHHANSHSPRLWRLAVQAHLKQEEWSDYMQKQSDTRCQFEDSLTFTICIHLLHMFWSFFGWTGARYLNPLNMSSTGSTSQSQVVDKFNHKGLFFIQSSSLWCTWLQNGESPIVSVCRTANRTIRNHHIGLVRIVIGSQCGYMFVGLPNKPIFGQVQRHCKRAQESLCQLVCMLVICLGRAMNSFYKAWIEIIACEAMAKICQILSLVWSIGLICEAVFARIPFEIGKFNLGTVYPRNVDLEKNSHQSRSYFQTSLWTKFPFHWARILPGVSKTAWLVGEIPRRHASMGVLRTHLKHLLPSQHVWQQFQDLRSRTDLNWSPYSHQEKKSSQEPPRLQNKRFCGSRKIEFVRSIKKPRHSSTWMLSDCNPKWKSKLFNPPQKGLLTTYTPY